MRRASLFLLFVTGCTGGGGITETGNPEMEMAFRARTSAPEAVSIGGEAAPVQLDRVEVSIEDVKFVQGEVCDAPGEREYDAPGLVADLLEEPDPVRFTVGEGEYCRVRVRLDGTSSDTSIEVSGMREDGTPFTIVSESTPEADVRSRTEPFTLAEGRDRLIMAFDVAKWFDGVDLGSAIVSGGEIRIDEDTNEAHLEAFEAAVGTALALYDDVDGSGGLDDDEDDAPLAVSE